MSELKQLREKRTGIAQQMRSMVEEHKGAFDQETQAKFDRMDEEQSALLRRIESEERVDSLERELSDVRRDMDDRHNFKAKKTDAPTVTDYHNAFRAWSLYGSEACKSEYLEAAKKCRIDLHKNVWDMRFSNPLTRATTTPQAAGTTSAGSETVANAAMQAIEVQLAAFGGVRESGATIIRTATGGSMPIPTNDDTGNSAVIVAENTAIDTEAIVFKQKTLGAFKYTSQFVKASVEFIQDASINVPAFVGGQLGVRVARGTNTHFTVGVTSDTQPEGVATGAISGVAGTTAGNITYANLVSLQHSVDPSYRSLGSCRWMFHDSSLKLIKQLVDSQSRPLWSAGMAAGEPDTILGYPYTINQALSTNTTATGGVKIVLFGPFEKYWIRDVMDVQLKRADERFIELGQVAWVTLSRHDGITVAASTGNWPIKALTTQST